MERRRKLSRQRFEEYLSGVRRGRARDDQPVPASVHFVEKRARKRLRSSRELIRHFFRLLHGQRLATAFSLLTLTVATVLALIPPAATKFVVDYVLGEKPMPAQVARYGLPTDRWQLLVLVTIGVLALSFVKLGLHIWGRWHATRVTQRVKAAVRKRVFEHAVRLPLHRVHELKSGGVASMLREDAGSVGELIFGMLYNPWRAVVQLFGSLCVLGWVDWRLLAGALVLLPVVFFTHRTWFNRIRPRYRDIRAQREIVDGLGTEAFSGMRVVRAFSRQRTETTRVMRDNHLMARQELYVWWWSRAIELVWKAMIPTASAALLLYGGWEVIHDRLTLGDLMMFLVYLMYLLEPQSVLAQSATQFQNSLSGLDRVLDLLDEPREMASSSGSVVLDKEQVAGKITFEDVSFTYVDAKSPALQGISLEVEPGQTIALVGASGAGKTTFCNLVARFYDPTEGTLRLDGRDVREIDVENYRRLLGVVEQDVFLFDGTVAENIGYAVRDATDADIRRAAKIANADEFICELKDEYETVIGERGVKLSGGQRQRIAIARAVLADPRILILDEATSNLDTKSERLIQRSLRELVKDRTCFIIAHRLSTIVHADRILVLDGGRICESGTHDELMATGDRYPSMVQAQTSLESGMFAQPPSSGVF